MAVVPEFGDILPPISSTPSCKGCGHPTSPKSIISLCRTNLKTLAAKAKDGCLVCLLLLGGVEACKGDGILESEELLIQITKSGVKTVVVRLLGTPDAISFFVPEGKYATPFIPFARTETTYF
jgi:hypothetical protein